MGRQEIERSFAEAGWELDGGFSDYLLIGYYGDRLSILAPKEAWETADTLFEIVDHGRGVSYWVHETPSPQQAQELLREHGEPSE